MLMSLLLLASQAPAIPIAADRAAHTDPPVHVWFNSNGDYEFGDRAKVYAKSAQNGYLVVLRADHDGRVRALFPVDPQDDQRVKGGKKYELKGRGGREAFVADDTIGRGTVLAAYSETPFRFDEFAKDGHWDTGALSSQGRTADPEAQLRDIVQRMEPNREHFDYDVATYVVTGPRYVRGLYADPYFYGWPGWWGYGFGPRFGTGLFIGPRFGYGFGPRFGYGFGPRFRSGFRGGWHR
jgi:hypothetical protein